MFLSLTPGVVDRLTFVISLEGEPINKVNITYLNAAGEVAITVSVPRQQPIECYNPRPFWIHWSSPNLLVGSGNDIASIGIAQLPIQDTPKVRGIALSTESLTAGFWEFDTQTGTISFTEIIG